MNEFEQAFIKSGTSIVMIYNPCDNGEMVGDCLCLCNMEAASHVTHNFDILYVFYAVPLHFLISLCGKWYMIAKE